MAQDLSEWIESLRDLRNKGKLTADQADALPILAMTHRDFQEMLGVLESLPDEVPVTAGQLRQTVKRLWELCWALHHFDRGSRMADIEMVRGWIEVHRHQE
ncbi:MAG: hypothetical protein ACYCW6_00125 [Candidatus Xenobia bacterium]